MPKWLISSAPFTRLSMSWLCTTPGNWDGKTQILLLLLLLLQLFLLKLFYPWALLESWEPSSTLKFAPTRRRAASSPRLSSATLQRGWADYDCKLIFIHVRAARFNFQHVVSWCAPEVAAVPAELSATLTSGGVWTRTKAAVRLAEPDFKDVTRDVSLWCQKRKRNQTLASVHLHKQPWSSQLRWKTGVNLFIYRAAL